MIDNSVDAAGKVCGCGKARCNSGHEEHVENEGTLGTLG
jgi:hypothetical protein